MRLLTFLPLVSCLSVPVSTVDRRTEEHAFPGKPAGVNHGTAFVDAPAVGSMHYKHLRIGTIAMACAENEHIYALELTYRDNLDVHAPLVTVTHGPMPPFGHADYRRHVLNTDEYIEQVNIRTWKAKVHGRGRTRIGYMGVITSSGARLDCGVYSLEDPDVSQGPLKSALLFFAGSAGDALDALQPYWIPQTDF